MVGVEKVKMLLQDCLMLMIGAPVIGESAFWVLNICCIIGPCNSCWKKNGDKNR